MFEVNGVVDCPDNSHLQFDVLLPYNLVRKHSFNPPAYEDWSVHFVYTYLLMTENFNRPALKQKLNDF